MEEDECLPGDPGKNWNHPASSEGRKMGWEPTLDWMKVLDEKLGIFWCHTANAYLP
jgi:hypothetical protein